MTLAQADTCPHCGLPAQEGFFCSSCNLYTADATGTIQKVTHTRRLFGSYLLEIVLVILTLGVGWLIWMYFTAKTSQSPAKRLVNIYILNFETGQPASAGRVWWRYIIEGALGYFIITGIINYGLVFFDKNRQALHDKLAKTIVVYAPTGLPESLQPPTEARPASAASPASIPTPRSSSEGGLKDTAEQLRELARLHDEGIITDEEYEAKRKPLADRL